MTAMIKVAMSMTGLRVLRHCTRRAVARTVRRRVALLPLVSEEKELVLDVGRGSVPRQTDGASPDVMGDQAERAARIERAQQLEHGPWLTTHALVQSKVPAAESSPFAQPRHVQHRHAALTSTAHR